MVREIVRDAIHLKMKAESESPLISVYEFCYAAGLGLKIMGISREAVQELKQEEDFGLLKEKIQEMVKASDSFESYPHGPRLKSLITGCRITGVLNEDANILFDMGNT